MIVRCANGHEFDDRESFECPGCYAEQGESIEEKFARLFHDVIEGRLG